MSTLLSSAVLYSSGPYLASSALFAVTTDAPFFIASSTKVRATPVPPISSTTMSAFLTTDIVSDVSSDFSIHGKSTSSGSRHATPDSSIGRPMRFASSSFCSTSRRAVCEPTVPAPSRPTRIGALFCATVRSFRAAVDAGAHCTGNARGCAPPVHNDWSACLDHSLTSRSSRSSTVCRRIIRCAPVESTPTTAGMSAWL